MTPQDLPPDSTAPAPEPAAADRRARKPRPGRDGLVVAATRLFAERGIHGTSLQQVAEAAGVSKAAIYHHFRTKEQVAEAVLAPALEAIAQIVRTARLHEDRRTQVESVIIGLADQAVRHRDLWAIVLHDTAVERVLAGDSEFAADFAQLPALLNGPRASEERQIRVSVFLSGIVAPALDVSRKIGDDVARRAIADAGRRLLMD